MAISIVGTPTAGSAAFSSTCSVNKPTGVASGDLLIATHTVDWGAYSDLTAPAGFTLISGASHDETGSSGGHVKTWYRVADGSEGSSFSFGQNSSADGSVSMIALRDATTTFVVAKDTSTGDTAPSVTPTASTDFLICVATSSQDDNTRTYTAPTGMTERTDVTTQYSSQSMATEQLASASATGTKDFGATGAVRSGHQAQVSIAVAAASSGTTHALASTGTGTSTGSLAVALVQATSSTGTGTTTGSVNLLLAPGALSATGTGTSAGSANLNATLALSATGTGQTSGSVDVTIAGGATTHTLSATGTGTTGGSAALVETLALSSTGTGTSTGSAALRSTLKVSATGTGQTAGSAALSAVLKVSSTGTGSTTGSAALVILGPSSVHQLAATGTGQTAGSIAVDLIEPVFSFSPPTHEEPIRVNHSGPFRVLAYRRMTYANSLIKVGGVWTATRVPLPEVVATLEEGVTFFRGGYEYEIPRSVAQDLAAAGYTAHLI